MSNKTEKVKITYVFTTGEEKTIIDIDATVSERHSLSSKVTKFPVEQGGPVTDNCSAEPATLEIEGIVSNFPLEIVGSIASAISGIVGTGVSSAFGSKLLGAGATGALAFKLPGLLGADTSDRAQTAKNIFDVLHQYGAPVNVYTGIMVYEDMLIEKVNIDRTSKTATGLVFKATFIKANIVSSEIVPVKSGTKSAGKSVDKGKITPTEVTGTKATKSQSILYKLAY